MKDILEIIAQIVGIFAVVLFLLSYQQKKRRNIIIFNASSRILYIVQYILLGAYAGAVLDVLGTVSSIAAQNKDKGFIKRHTKLTVIIINVMIFAAGVAVMIFTDDKFGLFSIAGVILHTSAFWISEEKTIRKVSFIGSPFWLTYNLVSRAYGSSIGDILSMISIGLAIYRYDIKGAKDKNK